jgi:uracil-DNA glycosylase
MKQDTFQKIYTDLKNFRESPLYKYRVENNYFPVLGAGNLDAKLMLVGEAPGENEAKTGKPFVGQAGKMLDGMLMEAGIDREKIFITSVVHDRPPKNKTPGRKETEAYWPFLEQVIRLIKPELIGTLGAVSAKVITEKLGIPEKFANMTMSHGQIVTANADWGETKVMFLYHPASILYNRSLKETIAEDFQKLSASFK